VNGVKKAVFIIAEQNFRDEEYQVPKEVLEKSGIEVVTASTTTGECVGKLGMKVTPEMLVKDIDPAQFDALIFVGGGGSEQYFSDKTAHELAHAAYDQGKIVGAICIAPVILANAGLLKGRTATVYPDGAPILKEQGANYTGGTVEVDGRIITGNGPEAAQAFGEKLAQLLS
jgi:protease I